MIQRFLKNIVNFFKKSYRIIYAAGLKFWEDDSYSKAAALTFYTIQSMVPFLAFILGISKGFGFEDYLHNLFVDMFAEQKEVINYTFDIAQTMLKDIKGKVIVGIGVLVLVWTTLSLLGYIELTLNRIWKIETPRTFLRKFNDYLAFVIICPIILIVSSSLTVYLKTEVSHFEGTLLTFVASLISLAFQLAPLVLSWILFFLLYFLMPNAKLKIWPRVIAGIFAGSLFQIWQWLYIELQLTIFNYNTVYGAFAAIPLLLIWLQLSWLIALAGAELAAHIEMSNLFLEQDPKKVETKITNKELGLLILYYCLKSFYTREPALTEFEISQELKIPLNITQKVLDVLVKGNILTRVKSNHDVVGYYPSSDPAFFSIKEICDIIEKDMNIDVGVEHSKPLDKISSLLKKLDDAQETSEGNIKLNALYK